MFIDAHCHLTDPKLLGRIDEVMDAAQARGIGAFILGGVNPADWDRQIELSRRYPGKVFPCFGLHPWFVAGRMGITGQELEKEIRRGLEILPGYLGQAAGLGELGLDLGPKTDPTTETLQRDVFVSQLRMARELKIPLVLHIVKAHSQAIRLLGENGPWPQGGLVHAFSGSFEIAEEYARLGFTLSIGGVAARHGYETLKRCLKKLPLEQVVVESDSPDQIPDGYQGLEEGVNDPRSLWMVAQEICRIKGDPGLTPEGVLKKSRENLDRIFGLESKS